MNEISALFRGGAKLLQAISAKLRILSRHIEEYIMYLKITIEDITVATKKNGRRVISSLRTRIAQFRKTVDNEVLESKSTNQLVLIWAG